jgi:hypothetical protein
VSLPSGTHLGPYEILSSLGAGGCGRSSGPGVSASGGTSALEVLPEEVAEDPARLRRFEREATAALSHANVLTAFDVGSDSGRFLVVTELLAGTTLNRALAAPSRESWRKALDPAEIVAPRRGVRRCLQIRQGGPGRTAPRAGWAATDDPGRLPRTNRPARCPSTGRATREPAPSSDLRRRSSGCP